jgi:hypothetical protein
VGGSLGRITGEGRYIYVLNCVVHAGGMKIFSPARSIRYLADEWMAVCFHHIGVSLDIGVHALRDRNPQLAGQGKDERFPPDGY